MVIIGRGIAATWLMFMSGFQTTLPIHVNSADSAVCLISLREPLPYGGDPLSL